MARLIAIAGTESNFVFLGPLSNACKNSAIDSN